MNYMGLQKMKFESLKATKLYLPAPLPQARQAGGLTAEEIKIVENSGKQGCV